jgi:arsenite methyltransferase
MGATLSTTMARIRGLVKGALYSGPRRERWQHPGRVVAVLGIEPGGSVADLGAGGGYFTYRLARAVGADGVVYAVDPDGDMLLRIRERAVREGYTNIATVPVDEHAADLPEPVDLVLVVDAFHHLPVERVDYLRALGRQIRPGGRVAVIEPHPRWYLFGHATEAAEIRETMAAAGYTPVAEHDFLPRQSFTVFRPREDASAGGNDRLA